MKKLIRVTMPYRPKDPVLELIRNSEKLQKELNIKVVKPPYKQVRGLKPTKFWISEEE